MEFSPVITDFAHLDDVLSEYDIVTDGKVEKDEIRFCKMEAQEECIFGTLSIPDLENLDGERIPVALFITNHHLIIADDDGIVLKVMEYQQRLHRNPYESKERYLYYLLTGLISRAFELLDQIEDSLMELERQIQENIEDENRVQISHFRQELLILRNYYEEISTVGSSLEENENEYFEEEQLRYFRIVSDRADRLMNKATHLLEFGKEVKEIYDSMVSAEQNASMQLLTVITSVFFPLTLITGWYGMNFTNMPELNGGYPFVICLSLVVLLVVVIYFKRKKLL